jgi:hypothetical protein
MKRRKLSSKKSLVLLPTVSFSLTYPTPPQPIILTDITTNSEDQAHLFEILKQIPKEKLGAFAKAINTLSTELTDHHSAINKNTPPS